MIIEKKTFRKNMVNLSVDTMYRYWFRGYWIKCLELDLYFLERIPHRKCPNHVINISKGSGTVFNQNENNKNQII